MADDDTVPEMVLLSTDPKDPNYRLVVRRNAGLWEVGQEELSSARPGAQVTDARCFVLTTDQAIWLHSALGQVLAGFFRSVWDENSRLVDRRNKLLNVCESIERILTFVPATYDHVLPELRAAIEEAKQ